MMGIQKPSQSNMSNAHGVFSAANTRSSLSLEQRGQLSDIATKLSTPMPHRQRKDEVDIEALKKTMTPEEMNSYAMNLERQGDMNSASLVWKAAHELKDWNASYAYALCQHRGLGLIPKDEKQGLLLLIELVNKGHPYAQFELAGLMKYGLGGAKVNLKKAFGLYHTAAHNGIKPARRAVGDAYLNGEGVDRDFSLAAEWYKLGGDDGDLVANYNLSLLYFDGRGVEKDVLKAIEYAEKAADAGVMPARHFLGDVYRTGVDGTIPVDYSMAFKHFKIAADNHFAPSAFNVGIMYREGMGVSQNTLLARTYFQIGGENADYAEEANDLIQRLEEAEKKRA
jgi:TPR repeat protein